jgi:hypothetical protein
VPARRRACLARLRERELRVGDRARLVADVLVEVARVDEHRGDDAVMAVLLCDRERLGVGVACVGDVVGPWMRLSRG